MTFGLENLFVFGKISDFHYTSRLSLDKSAKWWRKIPANQWQTLNHKVF